MTTRRITRAAAPWVCAITLLAAWPAQAQEEPAVIKRASELREAPADSGRAVATLAADSPVTRLGDRQGAWIKVRNAAGTIGWVHMFDIAPASSSGSSGATGALRGITSMFSKAPAQRTTTATATIGIRGLGAEDIAQAQPDVAAVGHMESLRASDADARQFARQAPLAAVSVDALPAPGGTGGTTSGTGGQQ